MVYPGCCSFSVRAFSWRLLACWRICSKTETITEAWGLGLTDLVFRLKIAGADIHRTVYTHPKVKAVELMVGRRIGESK